MFKNSISEQQYNEVEKTSEDYIKIALKTAKRYQKRTNNEQIV